MELLEERARWNEAEPLCARALKIESYSESLYQHLIRCRIASGDRAGARMAYEEMSELLFETFGVMPSDESRNLYREASKETNDQSVHIGTVREQLRETGKSKSAVFCEYDFSGFCICRLPAHRKIAAKRNTSFLRGLQFMGDPPFPFMVLLYQGRITNLVTFSACVFKMLLF